MKLKLLTLIPMLGLTTSAPVASMTTSNAANVTTLNAKIDKNQIRIMDKISVVDSINKGCGHVLDYCAENQKASSINSLVRPYTGWKERADLFTLNYQLNEYEAYYRYKSNNVEKDNLLSCGNAKKYKLLVTVPANTKEYKVEVVANCKIKNCVSGMDKYFKTHNRSFMQGNLSKLSTNENEILDPVIGLTDYDHEYNLKHNFKIVNQDSFLFDFYQNIHSERKPHIECQLHNEITLSNTENKPVEVPVYFWYSFWGGGYTGRGAKSHINCSEVTFSARHIA